MDFGIINYNKELKQNMVEAGVMAIRIRCRGNINKDDGREREESSKEDTKKGGEGGKEEGRKRSSECVLSRQRNYINVFQVITLHMQNLMIVETAEAVASRSKKNAVGKCLSTGEYRLLNVHQASIANFAAILNV